MKVDDLHVSSTGVCNLGILQARSGVLLSVQLLAHKILLAHSGALASNNFGSGPDLHGLNLRLDLGHNAR